MTTLAASVDELRALQEAGVELNETGRQRLIAAEQNAEAAADAAEAQKREVMIAANEIFPAYEAAQAAAREAYSAWCEASREAARLRDRYETVWSAALKLGLDVPTRIPPSARPSDAPATRW